MIFPAFPPSVARHGNANVISRVPRRSARGTNRLKAWAMSLGQVAVDDHVSPFMGDMTFIYIYMYDNDKNIRILNIVWFSSGFGFGPYLYYWIEPHSWKLHHRFFLTWQLKNSWRPGEIQRKMGPTKFSGTNIAMEITVSLGNDLQMVDVHGLSISIVSLLRGTRRKFDPRVWNEAYRWLKWPFPIRKSPTGTPFGSVQPSHAGVQPRTLSSIMFYLSKMIFGYMWQFPKHLFCAFPNHLIVEPIGSTTAAVHPQTSPFPKG